MVETLGELQKEILGKIATTGQPVHYVSELARILKRDQTTIFKSVQTLINWHILKSELEYKGGRSILRLTPKGAHYAVIQANVSYRDIVNAHPEMFETNLESRSLFRLFVQLGILDTYINALASYSINNNLYDDAGEWLLDEEKFDINRYKHHIRAIIIEISFALFSQPQAQKVADFWIGWAEKHYVKRSEIAHIIKTN